MRKFLIKAVGIETDLLTKILIIKNLGSHRLIRSLWEPLYKCISYFSHSFRNDSHISFQKDRIDSFIGLLQIWVHPLYIFNDSYEILFGAYQKVNHIFILSTDSYSEKEF